VCSDAQIAQLLQATATLSPGAGLRPHCYRTLFGLLACTGLRICGPWRGPAPMST